MKIANWRKQWKRVRSVFFFPFYQESLFKGWSKVVNGLAHNFHFHWHLLELSSIVVGLCISRCQWYPFLVCTPLANMFLNSFKWRSFVRIHWTSTISNLHGTHEKVWYGDECMKQQKRSKILVFHRFKNFIKLILYLVHWETRGN